MTEPAPQVTGSHVATTPDKKVDEARRARTARRYAAERRFEYMGLAAVMSAGAFLVILLWTIVGNAIPALTYNYVSLPINLEVDDLTQTNAIEYDFRKIVRAGLTEAVPNVSGRRETRKLRRIISSGAAIELRSEVASDPSLIGKKSDIWLPLSDTADLYLKNLMGDITRPESQRKISDSEIGWIDDLKGQGKIETRFNSIFFTHGASREPEMAGIWGAVVGSFLTLLVTLVLSVPIGVAAAIYLEEFAPKNRITDIIEININNLAAVPSIVFGLLGLSFFLAGVNLGWFTIGGFFPRSAAITGGTVLALMTLPTVIIASRASIKSVPPSIREAALGIGASKVQATFHHVLPLAMPGILTGTIIGMAGALGETAPLLLIGMVAFIVDIPGGLTEPATVLPVQIYMWADFPETAFRQKTAAAIMILLAFLICMNAFAVWLRNKFERRW